MKFPQMPVVKHFSPSPSQTPTAIDQAWGKHGDSMQLASPIRIPSLEMCGK